VREAIVTGEADAVAISSILHYDCLARGTGTDDYSSEGNTEFLKNRKSISWLHPSSIPRIKQHLVSNGVPCRTLETASQAV
jgi:cyclase